jgi:hypothetical protein
VAFFLAAQKLIVTDRSYLGAEDPRWPLSDGARQRPRAGKADYLAAAKAALASSKSRIFFSTL